MGIFSILGYSIEPTKSAKEFFKHETHLFKVTFDRMLAFVIGAESHPQSLTATYSQSPPRLKFWSARLDLNQRPPAPQAGALPS